jgi:hypothetical protein
MSADPSQFPGAPAGAPASAPRWWQRRGVRLGLWIAAVLLVLRLCLGLALPSLLDWAVRSRGLACQVGSLDLGLLAGTLELRELCLLDRATAQDPGDGALLLRVEFARVDVEMLRTMFGEPSIDRAEVDGVHLWASFDERGALNWSRYLPAPEEPAVEEPAAEPGGLDFTLPLRVRALRMQHLEVRVLDGSVQPECETVLVAQARVTDLGGDTRVEFSAASPGLVDRISLSGGGSNQGRSVDWRLALEVEGLRPGALGGRLAQLGLRAGEGRISLGGELSLQLAPLSDSELGAAGRLQCLAPRLVAEGVQCLAAERLEVPIARWTPGELALGTVELRGARALAQRQGDGAFSFAGIDRVGVAKARGAEPPPAAQSRPAAATGPARRFQFSLERWIVLDAAARLLDRTTAPATPFEFLVDQASLQDVTWPPRDGANSPLELQARAPGLAETIALRGGLGAESGGWSLALETDVDRLTLERARPHLARLGLQPELAAGSLRASLTARLLLEEPKLGGLITCAVQLRDGPTELAAVEHLGISGFELDRRTGAIRLGLAELSGLRARVRRDALGLLHAAGLATTQAPAAGSGAPARELLENSGGTAPPVLELPALALGKLRLQGGRVEFLDESVTPAAAHSLDDFGIELAEFEVGEGALGQAAPWKCWLEAPGLATGVTVQGLVRASRSPFALTCSAEGRAQRVELTALAAHLAPLGLEPVPASSGGHEGSFGLEAELRAADSAPGPGYEARLALTDLAWRDGAAELASCKSVRLEGVHWSPAGLKIGALEVASPHLQVEREASGALGLLGLRHAPHADSPASEFARSNDSAAGAAPDAAPSAASSAEENSPPSRFSLDLLRVEGASLGWSDRAASSPVAAEAVARFVARDLEFPPAGRPLSVELGLAVSGSLEQLSAHGTLVPGANSLELRLAAEMVGVRPGPLAPYLPAGIEWEGPSAGGEATLSARASRAPEGGLSLALELGSLRWSSAEREFAGLDRAELDLARVDPGARVFELRRASLSGARVDLERDAEGGLHALGLRIQAPRAESSAPPTSAPTAAVPWPALTGKTPVVLLGPIDFELARLRFLDRGQPGAEALLLQARLASASCRLLDPDPSALEPLRVTLQASAAELVGRVEWEALLSPFGLDAALQGRLRVRGVHGPSFARFAPALASRLDAGAMESGELDLAVEARLEVARRAPLDIDWSRGLQGEFVLKDFAVRRAPEAPVELGLDSLRAELANFLPATGAARFKSIELEKPRLRARRDARGLHLLGLCVPLGAGVPPETSPAGEGSEAGSAAAPSTEVASAPPPEAPSGTRADAPPHAPPDVIVDRLTIAGLDCELLDETAEPAAVVPLTGLDVEVKRFSLRGLQSGEPLAFSSSVQSGKVELPRRFESDSLLQGVAGATAALLSGEFDEKGVLEPRDLFGEVSLAGRLALLPEPNGWATFEVSQLELGAFRGLAGGAGVELGDGVLDLTVRARLRGSDGIFVDSEASFSQLSLSEPADGPISRYLVLPAPLDTVLFLLKDSEGRHVVPVGFRLTDEGISTASLAGAAAQAAGTVIARAVASSPLRLLGTLTDPLGLTGGDGALTGKETVGLDYEAGDDQPPGDAAAALDELVERLDDDDKLVLALTHQAGSADLARAALLANPAGDDCLRLSARLRRRKAELSRTREMLVAEVRAAAALGMAETAETKRLRVRALDRELGLLESSLDRVHEWLRPGAERRAAQRTRAALLSIAGSRVERIRQALLERGVAAERLRARTIRPAVELEGRAGRVLLTPVRGA